MQTCPGACSPARPSPWEDVSSVGSRRPHHHTGRSDARGRARQTRPTGRDCETRRGFVSAHSVRASRSSSTSPANNRCRITGRGRHSEPERTGNRDDGAALQASRRRGGSAERHERHQHGVSLHRQDLAGRKNEEKRLEKCATWAWCRRTFGLEYEIEGARSDVGRCHWLRRRYLPGGDAIAQPPDREPSVPEVVGLHGTWERRGDGETRHREDELFVRTPVIRVVVAATQVAGHSDQEECESDWREDLPSSAERCPQQQPAPGSISKAAT